jgi:hypothetical protein
VRPRASSLICRKSAANRATVREFVISAGRESPISRFHRARLLASRARSPRFTQLRCSCPASILQARPSGVDTSFENFFRESGDRFLQTLGCSLDAFFRDDACAREPSSMHRHSSSTRRQIRMFARVSRGFLPHGLHSMLRSRLFRGEKLFEDSSSGGSPSFLSSLLCKSTE